MTAIPPIDPAPAPKPDPSAPGSAKSAVGTNPAAAAKPAKRAPAPNFRVPGQTPARTVAHKSMRGARGTKETLNAKIDAHPDFTDTEKAFVKNFIAEKGFPYNNLDLHKMDTEKTRTITLTIANLS